MNRRSGRANTLVVVAAVFIAFRHAFSGVGEGVVYKTGERIVPMRRQVKSFFGSVGVGRVCVCVCVCVYYLQGAA